MDRAIQVAVLSDANPVQRLSLANLTSPAADHHSSYAQLDAMSCAV